ncbi:MAG: DsbA family protein [Rhodospirillales bacterium]|nr:DsbA family protein [Rhodospirillales bacterium]
MTYRTLVPRPERPVGRRIAFGLLLAAALPTRPAAAQPAKQLPAPPGLSQEEQRAVFDLANEDIFHDPAAPVLGNAQGDVTLVEFFDYRCPYCRMMAPRLATLIAKDRGLRLVMKEYPVLSRESIIAAKVALVAARHGVYAPFHAAMYALTGPFDEPKVMQVAQSVGLAPDVARREMDDPALTSELRRNLALGRILGINGTPAFVIGSGILPGAVGIEDLEKVIAAQRRKQEAGKNGNANQ